MLEFNQILRDAMKSGGYNLTMLEEKLRENGIENITVKRISDYLRRERTPSHEKARVLMDTLEWPISEEDLDDALRLNREIIREEKRDDFTPDSIISVPIHLRKIIPDVQCDAGQLIRDRVREFYGDERSLSKYVEMLIRRDLGL